MGVAEKIPHVYSFTATFEDGTQLVHDLSSPDVSGRFEGKTIFTDVLFKAGMMKEDNPLFEGKPELFEEMERDKVKLHSFVIHNDYQSVGVDLRDGHFELNGIPFYQHRPDLVPYKDFRVIYYRTVKHELNQQSSEPISGEVVCYAVGWQVTHKGQNVQKEVIV